MTKIKYFFLILLLNTSQAFTKSNSLKVGVVEFPPHINVTYHTLEGPLLNYIEQALEGIEKPVEFVLLPNKRAEREIKKGNIDLLVPFLPKDKEIKTLKTSIFNVVPGMCFRKKDYIPFLSAPGILDNLDVGIPANFGSIPAMNQALINQKHIEGTDVLNRGVQLLLKGRIDALYHPSPINVYHHTNPLYSKLACSYFHGYSRPYYVAISQALSPQLREQISKVFTNAMIKKQYEYFLLDEKSMDK